MSHRKILTWLLLLLAGAHAGAQVATEVPAPVRARTGHCGSHQKFRHIFSMKDDRESALPAIWSSSWSRSSDRVRETFAFMLQEYYLGRIRADQILQLWSQEPVQSTIGEIDFFLDID